MTSLDNRMHFKGDLFAVQDYLNDLVSKHNLDIPVHKENFLLPEQDIVTLLKKVMVNNMAHNETPEEMMVALAQRILWSTGEINALRRSNRRMRSQVDRLKKSLEKAKTPLAIYGTEEGFKQMDVPNQPAPVLPDREPEVLLERGKFVGLVKRGKSRPVRPERPPVRLVNDAGRVVGHLKDGEPQINKMTTDNTYMVKPQGE